jgi:hypothetical protein
MKIIDLEMLKDYSNARVEFEPVLPPLYKRSGTHQQQNQSVPFQKSFALIYNWKQT